MATPSSEARVIAAPLRVAHIAAEHSQLAHTGGLGEVVTGLSQAQSAAGHQVTCVLPGYRELLARLDGDSRGAVIVGMPWGGVRFERIEAVRDGVRIIALSEPGWFDRGGLYGDANGAFGDNPVRFVAFSRAAAQLVAGADVRADVVHLHDWHAGLVAPLLEEVCPRPARVMTIHNIAHTGAFPRAAFDTCGLPPATLHSDGVLHWDRINPLKAGLQYADRITTVSPTYARELLTDEGGRDLAGLLRHRQQDLVGILNGLAIEEPRGQRQRTALCDRAELSPPDGPLFAVVSRLAEQKGIDLFIEAVPPALEQGAAAVVLGTGDAHLTAALNRLQERFPGRVRFWNHFDPRLARDIFAGADVVCVPSRFEPCGLTQLHAMYHGALPLVRRTGGLADTVVDVGDDGWGFCFDEASASAMAHALERACRLYGTKRWEAAQMAAMAKPVGWAEPADAYVDLYRAIVNEPSAA